MNFDEVERLMHNSSMRSDRSEAMHQAEKKMSAMLLDQDEPSKDDKNTESTQISSLIVDEIILSLFSNNEG